MTLALQILATYAVASLVLGFVVILVDAATEFRFERSGVIIAALIVPPLVLFIVGFGFVVVTLIWGNP